MAEVKLVNWSKGSLDLAVASARTCYSPNMVFPEDLKPGQREKLGKGIYDSGHHTPFQHPTFTFALWNVSRHFVWNFLHNHPFYNSEQTSQRYTVVGRENFHVPGLDAKSRKTYEDAIGFAWDSYSKITGIISREKKDLALTLGKIKKWEEKTALKDLEKKAIENARYVLPIASHTNLYHTISGIVLQRYIRMMNCTDTPQETREVVQRMVEEVRKVDPSFVDVIGESSYSSQEFPEANASPSIDPDSYASEFDGSLAPFKRSKMIRSTDNPGEIIAEALKQSLGIELSPEQAVDLVMDPKKNQYLISTLNVSTHSPLMQALHHVHYTFRKKLSHCCDSQNQRHRGTPGSKPLLSRFMTSKPDYVVPEFVEKSESHGLFKETMERLWEAKNELIANGTEPSSAQYLLPNAVSIRFTESASLIHLVHKLKLRTCFNAQHEIYEASMEELRQIGEVHPGIARNIGPPCYTGYGSVKEDELFGPCTEGPRWCGIRVWLGWPKVRRPF